MDFKKLLENKILLASLVGGVVLLLIVFIICGTIALNQVFMNILVNATHAIKEKGTITIDTNYKNNNLLVKIKDTGCGIKEPDKIFFAGHIVRKSSWSWNRLRACNFTKDH